MTTPTLPRRQAFHVFDRGISLGIQELDGTLPKVQSLERGLKVILAFDAEHPRMTLSEIAKRTGLTRATARRFLHTLIALEYMETDGKEFALRTRILELGYSYLSSMHLPDLARPHLRELTEQVHESSSISVLDGHDVVYVARIPTRRIMTVAISVGTRFPAHLTSMGRAILSGMPPEQFDEWMDGADFDALTPYTLTSRDSLRDAVTQAREQGWVVVDQELEIGLRSIAAPVKDATGQAVAAVNISMSTQQGTEQDLVTRMLPHLQQAVEAISFDLAQVGR